jgi:hypothetical protein
MVPFLARDFTCLAADAHCGIGEKANLNIFLHIIVPPLVRAFCAFADHEIYSTA